MGSGSETQIRIQEEQNDDRERNNEELSGSEEISSRINASPRARKSIEVPPYL
jgi:hypothetical protein